jgi:plasmid stability protein
MGQVLIRNLEDDVIARLKQRAELTGVSLEQFLRDLLKDAAPLKPEEKVEISRRIRAGFDSEDWDTRAAIRFGRDDEFFELEKKFDTA